MPDRSTISFFVSGPPAAITSNSFPRRPITAFSPSVAQTAAPSDLMLAWRASTTSTPPPFSPPGAEAAAPRGPDPRRAGYPPHPPPLLPRRPRVLPHRLSIALRLQHSHVLAQLRPLDLQLDLRTGQVRVLRHQLLDRLH